MECHLGTPQMKTSLAAISGAGADKLPLELRNSG
jgi:hypothetical protein